jgi:hypothetical protein
MAAGNEIFMTWRYFGLDKSMQIDQKSTKKPMCFLCWNMIRNKKIHAKKKKKTKGKKSEK